MRLHDIGSADSDHALGNPTGFDRVLFGVIPLRPSGVKVDFDASTCDGGVAPVLLAISEDRLRLAI